MTDSQDVSLYLSPFMGLPILLVVSGSLDVCLQLSPLICLQSGRWCRALRRSLFTGLPSFFSLCACGARLSGCVLLLVSFRLSRPALWMPLFNSFNILVSRHVAPFLAGGVRLFGCVSSLVSLHSSPMLSIGFRLSECLLRAFTIFTCQKIACLSPCVSPILLSD